MVRAFRQTGWLLALCGSALGQAATPVQRALDRSVRASGAVAVVVDVASGRRLAAERAGDVATLRASPGSILKPLFLLAALRDGTVGPQTAVFCRRNLRIGSHALNCTHPQTAVTFRATEALAYSCNTYFAELARRLSAGQVAATLHTYALGGSSAVDDPATRQLLVLGVAGITVTPAQMAEAYLRLVRTGGDASPEAALVHQGMRESVDFGMAHNAAVPGLEIAGKTGTASDFGQTWSHGWFCGTANGVVLVVYLPRGTGADAARLAHDAFAAFPKAGAGGRR